MEFINLTFGNNDDLLTDFI